MQANLLAATKKLKKNSYVFNVGTGFRISLNDLIKTIFKLLNKNYSSYKIIHKDFRKGDIRHSLSSIKSIRKILNYNPNVSFKKGMQQTVRWFNLNR